VATKLSELCPGCGAVQTYRPGQESLSCAHCGTEIPIDKPQAVLPDSRESDWVLPFTLEAKDLEAIVHRFISGGKHTPDDILAKSQITKKDIYFLPTYLFSGTYKAKWTASFGYDRKEPYTAHRSNGEAYTAYRTVTDWRPASGTDAGEFAVNVYASGELDPRAVSMLETVTLRGAKKFSKKYVSGLEIRDFEVTSDAAFSKAGNSKIEEAIGRGVRSHSQGNRQQDWHWTASKKTVSETLLVPIAEVEFEYEGKAYAIWIDATDPSKIVSDPLPTDESRKSAMRWSFGPFAVAAISALFVNNYFGLANTVSAFVVWGVAAATLIFGFVRRNTILSHSNAIRSALLTQKEASESTNNNLSDVEIERLANSYVAPAKPFIADTSKDRWLLPAITAVAVVFMLLVGFVPQWVSASGGYVPSSSSDASTEAEDVEEESDPVGGNDLSQVNWYPEGYSVYYDDTSIAWQWNNDSYCAGEPALGCWAVDLSVDETCLGGVTVEMEEKDADGNFLGYIGATSEPMIIGDLATLQIDSEYGGESGSINYILCNGE